MRFAGTALTLLSLGSLSGCTGTPALTTVASANQPSAIQHSVNRYEMHGSPDKVALLVDSETGEVWRYTKDGGKEQFVPVAVPQKAENWVRGKDGKLVCVENCPKTTITP